jgi:hypothetical protein
MKHATGPGKEARMEVGNVLGLAAVLLTLIWVLDKLLRDGRRNPRGRREADDPADVGLWKDSSESVPEESDRSV